MRSESTGRPSPGAGARQQPREVGEPGGTRERPRSLARGAAVITIATAASRVTGFLRVVVVAAAMGTTYLSNTYQTANTAPNLVFELVAAGVLTSVFVPTFVGYLVKDERQEGWNIGNILNTVAIAALIVVALLIAIAAPVFMRLMTAGVQDPELRAREIEVGTTLLRLFAPQVVFYGAGMIMTGALHAHRRFAMAAVAPIFNNAIVIATYLTYAAMRGERAPSLGGITSSEIVVLGAGTTLGVVAMTVCLIPPLRSLGWRFRWRFEPRHPAVKKAARLGAWALGYAGGYQAGLIVVLLLANRVEGGVAAYQWAYTFFYVPHALFAMPVFHVLFPAMAEHVARGEQDEFLGRLRDGLGILAFIMTPIAAFLLTSAEPLAEVTLRYGVMSGTGADLVARVLLAFSAGLPLYSAFLVFTRAHYAVGDTKTPALVNGLSVVLSSAIGAALYFNLPDHWSVAGLAFGHSIGFAIGAGVLARYISVRVSYAGTTQLMAAVIRAVGAAAGAMAVMVVVRLLIPDDDRLTSVVSLVATGIAGAAVYLAVMWRLRSPELARVVRLVKHRA